METEKVQKEVISLVQLLFEQLKLSDEGNREAIKENTSAIVELIKLVGDSPQRNLKAIEKVVENLDSRLGEKGSITERIKELEDGQKGIKKRFDKVVWVFGIVIAVIGIVMTLMQFLDKFVKSGG